MTERIEVEALGRKEKILVYERRFHPIRKLPQQRCPLYSSEGTSWINELKFQEDSSHLNFLSSGALKKTESAAWDVGGFLCVDMFMASFYLWKLCKSDY